MKYKLSFSLLLLSLCTSQVGLAQKSQEKTDIYAKRTQKNKTSSEVPTHVREAAKRKAANTKIDYWITQVNSGKHVAVLIDGSVLQMDTEGNWISTAKDIRKNTLPVAVRATLKEHVKIDGYKWIRTTRVEDAMQGPFYIAHLSLNGRLSKLFVDVYGEVLRNEREQT